MDEDTVKSRGLRRNLSRRGLFSIVDFPAGKPTTWGESAN